MLHIVVVRWLTPECDGHEERRLYVLHIVLKRLSSLQSALLP